MGEICIYYTDYSGKEMFIFCIPLLVHVSTKSVPGSSILHVSTNSVPGSSIWERSVSLYYILHCSLYQIQTQLVCESLKSLEIYNLSNVHGPQEGNEYVCFVWIGEVYMYTYRYLFSLYPLPKHLVILLRLLKI